MRAEVATPLLRQASHTAARPKAIPEQLAQNIRAQYLRRMCKIKCYIICMRGGKWSDLQRLCHLPQRKQQVREPSLWGTGGVCVLGLELLNKP